MRDAEFRAAAAEAAATHFDDQLMTTTKTIVILMRRLGAKRVVATPEEWEATIGAVCSVTFDVEDGFPIIIMRDDE